MENVPKLAYGEAIEFIAGFCKDHEEKLYHMSNTRAILWVCIMCELMPEWEPLANFMEESQLHMQVIYDFVLGYKVTPPKGE
jgi:hypothetical protein